LPSNLFSRIIIKKPESFSLFDISISLTSSVPFLFMSLCIFSSFFGSVLLFPFSVSVSFDLSVLLCLTLSLIYLSLSLTFSFYWSASLSAPLSFYRFLPLLQDGIKKLFIPFTQQRDKQTERQIDRIQTDSHTCRETVVHS
jgi:hypothetical protein